MGRECGNCAAFLGDKSRPKEVGFCRRHPPQVLFLGVGERTNALLQNPNAPRPEPIYMSRFPQMFPDGYCYEHVEKTTKE